MITDVHAHYHPHAYAAALDGLEGGAGGGFPGQPDTDDADDIRARIEMMDEAGVGLQILSPAAARAPYGSNETASIHAARLGNDLYAELVSRYPNRFKAFVSLPLPHVDASLKELERGMDDLAMIGVNLHISVLNRSVAEDEFLPIYEEINRRRGIVFYHPCGNGLGSAMLTDYRLGFSVGTAFEDTLIALHLILKRIPWQFPDITFIIPHLGGPLAMLLHRVDSATRRLELPESASTTAGRFYYDTVCYGSHVALLAAHRAFGANHLLPGSDYPALLSHERYADTFSWIEKVELPASDREEILHRTANTLLKVGGAQT